MRLRMLLEYDGTTYSGWQVQPDQPTIQEALERALRTVLGHDVKVEGAGRTDAGVHASGQVAAFTSEKVRDLHALERSLNALAGPGIAVLGVQEAPTDFDPRRDARRRRYEYRILNRPWSSPFRARYAWHVHDSLDLSEMNRAAGHLVGEHDLSSFQAADCDAGNAVRRIFESGFEREGEELVYGIEATAFLRHMVRNVVGTLVEVGRGLRDAAGFRDLLLARDRRLAGPTAPAHGLCLVRIDYE